MPFMRVKLFEFHVKNSRFKTFQVFGVLRLSIKYWKYWKILDLLLSSSSSRKILKGKIGMFGRVSGQLAQDNRK